MSYKIILKVYKESYLTKHLIRWYMIIPNLSLNIDTLKNRKISSILVSIIAPISENASTSKLIFNHVNWSGHANVLFQYSPHREERVDETSMETNIF